MHELSLVESMVGSLQSAYPNRLHQIRRFTLRVGELSNVQPVLMQNAFAAYQATHPEWQQVQLQIEQLPVVVLCPVCEQRTTIENYTFVCSCGLPCKNLVQGDELEISMVELDASGTPDADAP